VKLWDLRKQHADMLWRHRNHNDSQPQKNVLRKYVVFILELQNTAEIYFAEL
jgi:hypothetical protein